MKQLESYHRKMDEYSLQFPWQDPSQRIHLSTVGSIFLDLFVLPSLRLISTEYQTPHEVRSLGLSFSSSRYPCPLILAQAVEIVDWISSVVSLLRLVVIRQADSSSSSVIASHDVLVWKQAMEFVDLSTSQVENLLQTLREWHRGDVPIQGRKPPSSQGVINKYELIQMNLMDTASLLSHLQPLPPSQSDERR
jgi:hypothetical protein